MSVYLACVDLGTTYIKASLYDEAGFCAASDSMKTVAEYSRPGVYSQDADSFVAGTLRLLGRVLESSGKQAGDIAAIAFTGQMAGAVGVDRDWQAVTPWTNTLDTRHMPYGTRMLASHGDEILRLCGTNSPFMAPKMKWIEAEYPGDYGRARKFMILTSYVMGKISDTPVDEASMDRTYLTWTGVADIKNGVWSDQLCGDLGIDKDRLPRIVESTRVVGKLSAGSARICGLLPGTPIVAGAGDKPAGCIGAGIVTPGMMIDESSTVAALSVCVDRYASDLRYRSLEIIPSPVEGQYYGLFYIAGSGLTMEWFTDTFAQEEKAEGLRSGRSVYEVLEEKARKVPPGSDGLVSIGMLGGRALPSDPDIKGLWLGHAWSHKKEHFYRSLLEGFAYEYGYCVKVIRETFPEIGLSDIRSIGGGARSGLWNSIKADVTGLRYTSLDNSDFSLLGTSIIAGSAVGVHGDIRETALRFARETDETEPDPRRHDHYKRYVEIYESIFTKVRGIYSELSRIPPHGRS